MTAESVITGASTYPRGFSRDTNWQWPLVPARELVTLNYGRALKADTRKPGSVPVFGTNGQCGWHDEPLAKGPGLILGRKGQGPLGVEWSDEDFWVIDTAYYVSFLTSNVDLRYLYYLVKYVGLNHLKDGTSNPTLSRDTFGAQLFPLPPLLEQKAIATVLRALDDKIELNRRMNATLEAMARALFQSWFVDFDPVRAKTEGRPPVALDESTAALFPAQFQDSALGLIPQGWEVSSLDRIANYLNGLALQKFPPRDGPTLPVIKIAQLRKGASDGADRCNTDVSAEYIIADGDVLFSWSGSLEVELWCGGPGALNQHLFKVTSSEFPKWFYYLWTRYHLEDFRRTAASKATTMGHIQRRHLSEAKAVIPTGDLLHAMDKHMGLLIAKVIANQVERRQLASIRDALLPQLLSGELQIPEAAPISNV